MSAQSTNPALAAFHKKMIEGYRREALMQDLREREQAIVDRHADPTCAGASTCPFHRCPGELFNTDPQTGG
jgi:hypothetical protein